MPTIVNPSRSARLRCVALAALLAAAATGCGSAGSTPRAGRTDPADQGSGGSASPDRASQPLEASVADMAAPTDGRSASRIIDINVWVGDVVFERCEVRTTFMSAGDRYDQAMFPDLDLIASNGIALGAVSQDPEPSTGTPDEKCVASTIPELADVQKAQGEWMETVAGPTWNDASITEEADDATACLRDRMEFSSDDLPSLDGFFGAVDGRVTHMSSMTESERAAAINALDDQASDAFVDCATDTYKAFAAKLAAARPAFLDRHGEAIAGLAAALDASGYTP